MTENKVRYRKVKTKVVPTLVRFDLKKDGALFVKAKKMIEVK